MMFERDSSSIGESVRRNGGKKRKNILEGGRRYKRYFDGYTVVEVPKENGVGIRYEYIYTADYYERDVPDRRRLEIKGAYLTAILLVLFLFISNVCTYSVSNMTWYVTLPQAFCVAMLAWFCLAGFRCLTARARQTTYEYQKSSTAFVNSSLMLAITLSVETALLAVFAVLNFHEELVINVLMIGKYVLCAVIIAAVHMMEKRSVYVRTANQNRLPANGIVIGTIGIEDPQDEDDQFLEKELI